MKDLKPNPIIAPWASGTENRIAIDQTTRENGVLYKGPVVSNQLNGMAYDIYSSVMYNQFTGGMYNNSLTYNEGQFCTIYWQKSASSQKKFLKCICANTDPAGITAIPPISGASVQLINGVEFYSGGALDDVNWRFYEEAPFQTFDVNVPFNAATTDEYIAYQLFEIPNTLPQDTIPDGIAYQSASLTKVLEIDAICYVEKTNISQVDSAYYMLPLKIKASYILTPPDGGVGAPAYVLMAPYGSKGCPIEISYGEISQKYTAAVYFYPVKPGTEYLSPHLFYGMPYGLAITTSSINRVGATTSVIVESRGLNNMRIVGTGTVQINPVKVEESSIDVPHSWTFVVRPGGGTSVLPEVGSTKSYAVNYAETQMMSGYDCGIYGQLSLFGIAQKLNSTQVVDNSKNSMWFRLINKQFDLFDTLQTIQSMTLPQLMESFFPRIAHPNIMSRVSNRIGSTQQDAIRNITGEFRWSANIANSGNGGFYTSVTSGSFSNSLFNSTYWYGAGSVTIPNSTHPIAIDVSRQLPTTDTITGEIRPKSVVWEYRLQCF